jgi:hypothetical protein
MKAIPAAYAAGPFARAAALADGLSPKMLRGQRFTRLHPRVHVARDHELTWDDLILAAKLALPERVHLTGISRIQAAGLDFGPRSPVRFVIQGDHHLAIDGIFLHRTKLLPPLDEVGVTLEAAYIFYCAQARVIDAIKVGDWLLHNGLIDLDILETLAVAQLWRPGCNEALWVLPHLDPDSWSLKESETRPVLVFAGLPRPECNQPLELLGVTIRPDLLYRRCWWPSSTKAASISEIVASTAPTSAGTSSTERRATLTCRSPTSASRRRVNWPVRSTVSSWRPAMTARNPRSESSGGPSSPS